jgi:hypothetical protein
MANKTGTVVLETYAGAVRDGGRRAIKVPMG